MDIGLIKAILPKVPFVAKTALFHTLGLSDTSSVWDLKEEVIINTIRSFVVGPDLLPVSTLQNLSLKDPGIKGKIWISKIVLPRPEDDGCRDALIKAIENLKEPSQSEGGFTIPDIVPVEAEWTGYRKDATKSSPRPNISESEMYTEMMKEVTSDLTILYLHGGAHYLMDPASHRLSSVKLAKLTKGRVLSVRYRLAPQHAFPAALLDALIVYMSLLYPPSGSLHTAVPASKIVFAGDSAGANLCMALLQLILELQRQDTPVIFNGESHKLVVPAAVTCNSAWLDITHALPSCSENRKYDYLPHLSALPDWPDCSIWPTKPPRRHLYVEDAMFCHPLVSPLASQSWAGSCPILLLSGQEMLSDESEYVARLASSQGVTVVYEKYMAMPHCFSLIFDGSPRTRRCFDTWIKFLLDAVNDPASIQSSATVIAAKPLTENVVQFDTLFPMTHEDLMEAMHKSVEKKLYRGEGNMAKL